MMVSCLRYTTHTAVETGLAHGEGRFLACSFWLADCFCASRKADRGRVSAYLSACSLLCNDVGLFSRRNTNYGSQAPRRQFSPGVLDVGLVNTALNLTRASKPAEQRAGEAAPGV